MVLEQLKDGASRQLLEDEGTRKLVFILCLPLIDGVFATLLVSGAVETFSDVLTVGLTIFSGAGALAILYSYSDTREDALRMIRRAAPILLIGSALVGAVAPFYDQFFYTQRLSYAAGIALLVIAAQIMGVRRAEGVQPSVIILVGMALSVRPSASLAYSPSYIVPAVSTALVAMAGLYVGSFLVKTEMNIQTVKRGAALVLAMIGTSMFGLNIPSELGLMVFTASIFLSLRS